MMNIFIYYLIFFLFSFVRVQALVCRLALVQPCSPDGQWDGEVVHVINGFRMAADGDGTAFTVRGGGGNDH